MKGNSNKQPDAIVQLGNKVQVRWNITRNDRTGMDGIVTESWDYDYADCSGSSYPELVEAVIRHKYTQGQAEAILSNYLDGKHTEEYMAFQQHRALAKAVATGVSLKADIDAMQAPTPADRIGELEVATTAVIEVLTEKGITP
jgi:hypothetical protein